MEPREQVLELDVLQRAFQHGHAAEATSVARRAYEATLETHDENLVGRAISNLGTAFVVAGRGS